MNMMMTKDQKKIDQDHHQDMKKNLKNQEAMSVKITEQKVMKEEEIEVVKKDQQEVVKEVDILLHIIETIVKIEAGIDTPGEEVEVQKEGNTFPMCL